MSNTNYSQSFEGIVSALTDVISTVSGVGTTSFTLSSQGYPANFAGVVQAISDLNSTLSGVTAGGGGGSSVVAGSGIYLTPSGSYSIINSSVLPVAAGSGIYLTSSGEYYVINSAITSASGTVFSAGSGLYLTNSTEFNINFASVFQNSVSGSILAEGSNTIRPSGNTLTISGVDVSSIRTYTAAETISSGQFVAFVNGALVVASAASGVDASRHNAFGAAVNDAAVSGSVRIDADHIVPISSANITADTQLTPGENYYLSKFSGQITKFSTASGSITFSEGYGALVYVGRALSSDQLEVEIQPKIILTE